MYTNCCIVTYYLEISFCSMDMDIYCWSQFTVPDINSMVVLSNFHLTFCLLIYPIVIQ
jgi:hypothetical protein